MIRGTLIFGSVARALIDIRASHSFVSYTLDQERVYGLDAEEAPDRPVIRDSPYFRLSS